MYGNGDTPVSMALEDQMALLLREWAPAGWAVWVQYGSDYITTGNVIWGARHPRLMPDPGQMLQAGTPGVLNVAIAAFTAHIAREDDPTVTAALAAGELAAAAAVVQAGSL